MSFLREALCGSAVARTTRVMTIQPSVTPSRSLSYIRGSERIGRHEAHDLPVIRDALLIVALLPVIGPPLALLFVSLVLRLIGVPKRKIRKLALKCVNRWLADRGSHVPSVPDTDWPEAAPDDG